MELLSPFISWIFAYQVLGCCINFHFISFVAYSLLSVKIICERMHNGTESNSYLAETPNNHHNIGISSKQVFVFFHILTVAAEVSNFILWEKS